MNVKLLKIFIITVFAVIAVFFVVVPAIKNSSDDHETVDNTGSAYDTGTEDISNTSMRYDSTEISTEDIAEDSVTNLTDNDNEATTESLRRSHAESSDSDEDTDDEDVDDEDVVDEANDTSDKDENETGDASCSDYPLYPATPEEAGVSDTTPPFFVSSSNPKYITVGETFNLDDCVGYIDDFDRNVTLTQSGSVDTSTPGSYPVTAIITDSAGNSSSMSITVKVVSSSSEIPAAEPASHMNYSDFIATYKVAGTSVGIDVSKWQGDVDFEKVRDAGCQFVIMRMGVTGSSYELDSYFLQNYKRAREAGLKVGVYMSTKDYDADLLREHLIQMIEDLGGDSLDFPIVFDWESWGKFQQYHMNLYDINNLLRIFMNTAHEYGYEGMLYSSRNKLGTVWLDPGQYTLWYARYNATPDYSDSPYIMWQKGQGYIDGIAGEVDLNIYYDTFD